MKTITKWAILHRSENKLDGKREQLTHLDGMPMVFATRTEARIFNRFGCEHLKRRKDLQAEPFGWKLPKVVKVKIQYKILKG